MKRESVMEEEADLLEEYVPMSGNVLPTTAAPLIVVGVQTSMGATVGYS